MLFKKTIKKQEMRTMKRRFASFAIAGIMFMVACGTQGVNEASQQTSSERISTPVVDPITIRFAHNGPDDPNDQMHQSALFFAQRVNELSNGAMQVNIYPASQMGTTDEILELMSAGEVHMGDIENAPLTRYVPETMWIDLPYVIQSYEHAEAVFNARSDVSRWIRPIFVENGFRVLGVYHSGFRNMMNTRGPINHPSDMEDLLIRVMNSEVMIQTMIAFGADAIVLPFAEVYGAVERGEIDGQEQALAFTYSMNFFEVLDYLSMTEHFYNPRTYIFSEVAWQQLTSAQRLIIIEATEDAINHANRVHHENQAVLMQNILATGMNVNYLSDANMAAFISAGQSIWPMFYEPIGSGNAARGNVILEMILSYIP